MNKNFEEWRNGVRVCKKCGKFLTGNMCFRCIRQNMGKKTSVSESCAKFQGGEK